LQQKTAINLNTFHFFFSNPFFSTLFTIPTAIVYFISLTANLPKGG